MTKARFFCLWWHVGIKVILSLMLFFVTQAKFCTWRISDKWECYSHFITCHISNETRTISVFANGMTNNQFEFISLVFTLINILCVYLPINVIWTFDKYVRLVSDMNWNLNLVTEFELSFKFLLSFNFHKFCFKLKTMEFEKRRKGQAKLFTFPFIFWRCTLVHS